MDSIIANNSTHNFYLFNQKIKMKKTISFLLVFLTTTIAIAQTSYNAYCVKPTHDGDTASLLINIGMGIYIQKDCRLIGLDTPEVST